MRNGYVSDLGPSRHFKRDKHKSSGGGSSKGPLVLLKPGRHFQEGCVQLQYPQPVLPSQQSVASKPNGVVYADLDMSPPTTNKQSVHDCSGNKKTSKAKTEYATLKFNEVGQEIDV